jgi:hypothetical protein
MTRMHDASPERNRREPPNPKDSSFRWSVCRPAKAGDGSPASTSNSEPHERIFAVPREPCSCSGGSPTRSTRPWSKDVGAFSFLTRSLRSLLFLAAFGPVRLHPLADRGLLRSGHPPAASAPHRLWVYGVDSGGSSPARSTDSGKRALDLSDFGEQYFESRFCTYACERLHVDSHPAMIAHPETPCSSPQGRRSRRM